MTLLVEVPIDNQIKEWTALSMPSNWEAIRDRWEFFHTLRTFCSVLSFAFLVGAVVLPKDRKESRII
ncbi:MAG: hypothetical protein ACJ76F_07665 [Bacteroidia bacterium]